MRKLLFIFGVMLMGQSSSAQSLEIMGGNNGLFADVQFFKPLSGTNYRFSVFSRTRGTLSYENKANILTAAYFNYTSKVGVGASLIGSLSSSNGVGGAVGINYFKAHKALTVFILTAVEIDDPPRYSYFSIFRYQPKIKGDWKLYTSLELYSLFGNTGHLASVQRVRVGVDWKKLQFGPAANLSELGSDPFSLAILASLSDANFKRHNMKIAIIGTGNVGGALATKWSQAGHQIFLGVQNLDDFKGKNLLENRNTSVHLVSEAVSMAEVILIATPATAAVSVAKSLGDTSGKVIIDAMNIIMGQGPERFDTTAEAILAYTNTTDVVKCFNTTGFNNMIDPVYDGVAIDAFTAGDSEKGKQIATQLAKDAGFAECYDVGGNDRFKLMEQFAWFWINLAMVQKQGREIGFKLHRR